MSDIIKRTEQWFSRRNSAWLDGDLQPLSQQSGIQPAVGEMERRRELLKKRGGVDRKIISDVDIVKVNREPATARLDVFARESIRFLYELDGVMHHEQRMILHRMGWDASTGSSQPALVEHHHDWETEPDNTLHMIHTYHGNRGDAQGEEPTRHKASFEPFFDHRGGYNRTLAFRYAQRWWNDHNPDYMNMGVDCTNYVSQVLHAGGFPMIKTSSRDSGWWYQRSPANWSYSWSIAHALAMLLTSRKNPFRVTVVDKPQDLMIGDVISYDWNNSGTFTHSTVVTGHDANGFPLVNAHTVNSHQRYFSYEDSYAFTPNTHYLFVHFLD